MVVLSDLMHVCVGPEPNVQLWEPYQDGGDDERAVGQGVRDVGGAVLVAVRHVKATVGVPDPNLHTGERVRAALIPQSTGSGLTSGRDPVLEEGRSWESSNTTGWFRNPGNDCRMHTCKPRSSGWHCSAGVASCLLKWNMTN